jgi:hypothetical protein
VLSITIVKTAYFINLKNKLMTRAEALKRTREKFTNLLDGKALPNVSITEIILYYETLVAKNAAPAVKRSSGILDNFREAEIQQYEEDNDEWYGQ